MGENHRSLANARRKLAGWRYCCAVPSRAAEGPSPVMPRQPALKHGATARKRWR
jgi:hypothetical protein